LQQQQQQQQQQDDALAVAQNGGISSSDEGDMDGDGDDLDDDMMDRISSSPSIEDGTLYNLSPLTTRIAPLYWPQRLSSLPLHLRSRGQSLGSPLQSAAPVTPLPLFSQHQDAPASQTSRPHRHQCRAPPEVNVDQPDDCAMVMASSTFEQVIESEASRMRDLQMMPA
jgi:hypothetical protein